MGTGRRTGTRASGGGWTLAVALALGAAGAAGLGGGFHLGRLEEPIVLVPASAALVAAILLLALAAAGGPARRREAKLSAELTALSRRLLRLEDAARDAATGRGPNGSDGGELARDVAALSRVVVQLAEAVSAQAATAARPSAAASGRGPARVAAEGARIRLPAATTGPLDVAAASPARRPANAPPTPGEPARADAAILGALEAGRIELQVRSVVTLPQRRTHLLEAVPFLRLADGALVPAAQAEPALDRMGHRRWWDAEVLVGALAGARHLQAEDGVGVLLPLGSAPDGLGRALELLEPLGGGGPDGTRRIVLWGTLAAWTSAWAHEADAVARLRSLGLRTCLSEIGDAQDAWSTLAERGVSYVKLRADDLLGDARARRQAADAARCGMVPIATDVSREGDIPDLIELDIPLASGAAFEGPRAVRFGRAEASPIRPEPSDPERSPDGGSRAARARRALFGPPGEPRGSARG